MTTSARTVETNAAHALYELLAYIGDGDNASQRLADFENSFSSWVSNVRLLSGEDRVEVRFEDGSVLHLTITQVKEPNQ